MATVYQMKNGGYTIQFFRDGKRETLYLGRAPDAFAEEFKIRTDAILLARKYASPLDPTTRTWLKNLPPEWRMRMSEKGLIDAIEVTSIEELCCYCIERAKAAENRGDIAPSTIIKYRDAADALKRFFGKDRSLASIASDDAEDFKAWLLKSGGRRKQSGSLAPSTVTVRCKQAKQFFGVAVKRRWIEDNPFDGLRWDTSVDPERQCYVERDAVKAVMSVADAETRLLLAIARFGGVRVPSEVVGLTWGCVDWHRGLLTVHAPKTKRHEGKSRREVPIDQMLRVELEAARPSTDSPDARLGSWGDVTNAALTGRLERACSRASIRMWAKPWQNLRSSRETELLNEGHPIHAVCYWMGNSPKIALKHYAQVTPDQVARVTGAAADQGQARSKGGRPRTWDHFNRFCDRLEKDGKSRSAAELREAYIDDHATRNAPKDGKHVRAIRSNWRAKS